MTSEGMSLAQKCQSDWLITPIQTICWSKHIKLEIYKF